MSRCVISWSADENRESRKKDMTKKIAVINDLSGFGKCSLTAAISAIAAMGVQPCPLPTAVLSAQTGSKSGSGKLTATATCCPATVAARADLTTFVTFDGGLTWED